jgi:hypothetical protein
MPKLKWQNEERSARCSSRRGCFLAPTVERFLADGVGKTETKQVELRDR